MQHIVRSLRLAAMRLTLCLALFSPNAWGQTMDSLLVKAPADVLPLVRYNARLDLLDYFHSGMTAKVQNDLGGTTRLIKLTHRHCVLSLSDIATLEMRLLPTRGDSIVAVVRNVDARGTSGRIAFYSRHWRERRIDLPMLRPSQFVLTDSLPPAEADRLVRLVATLPYAYHWDEHRDALTLLPSTEGLTRDEAAAVKPRLHPVVWRWSEEGGFLP